MCNMDVILAVNSVNSLIFSDTMPLEHHDASLNANEPHIRYLKFVSHPAAETRMQCSSSCQCISN